jgi:2-polyprenyl-3-methyl-5-hydroxy-6-metoxy-1,4-benzoquinol methylase
MKYDDRIPKELIKDGHYSGRPADFEDKIITRRINLVKQIPGFTGKNLELLDIGCGNGASLFKLAPEMKYCLGIDVETGNKEEFDRYKKESSSDNCEFRLLNLENEKIGKQFDRIISFEVIEHLKDDKNVHFYFEALKSGGIGAITVPNKWWVFETHGARLPLLKWNRVPFFSWLPRFIHERYSYARIYTKSRIKKLLTDAGFEVVTIKYVTAPMDVLKDGSLKRFLVKNIFHSDTTSVPFLATSIFVVVKNK